MFALQTDLGLNSVLLSGWHVSKVVCVVICIYSCV